MKRIASTVDGFDLNLLIEFFGQNVPATEEGS